MAAVLAVVLLSFALLAPAHAMRVVGLVSASAKSTDTGAAVLDVVMLVDESGSETDANVAAEKQTAGTIAQAMLNPRSRVTVVGFGGVNNVVPDQDPVNVACYPTITSGAKNLSYLALCVNSLHRRTEAEGDDTDYAAALGTAMSFLSPNTPYGRQSPAGAIKVILMMTDGGVNVSRDTQQYGTDWLNGEHQAVNEQLAAARAYGVQVWPLGFGVISPTDQAYLAYLAANGSQTGCDNRAASKPRSTVVQNPANALAALDALYASAGCLGSSSSGETIGGATTRSLYVTVPAVASDAVISVNRVSPAIQVSFYRPDGTLWNDESAISGTDTAVEVLHAVDPQPGQWRIQLTAPPGLASKLGGVTVFWQGEVQAPVTVTPSITQPGKPITVTLTVLGADGSPITDLSTLAQLQVAVSVSGDGLPGLTAIPVSSVGQAQGAASGVGVYQGTFIAPQRQGRLTFTSTVAGYGLYAQTEAASVLVTDTASALNSTVQLPAAGAVTAGLSIQGEVTFANETGRTRAVQLSLGVSHAFAAITSPAGTVQVSPGRSAVPFTITFARNSPLGAGWLEVKVLDATNPAIAYAAGTLEVVVNPRLPSVGHGWAWAGLVILIILGSVLVFLRRYVGADVRGLSAVIRHDGEQIAELRAPGKRAGTFRFVIRDEGEPTERLQYPRTGDAVYAARRGRTGRVDVVTPAGKRYHIAVEGPGEPLPGGLRLAFRDRGRPSKSPPSSPGPGGTSARTGTTPADPGPTPSAPSPQDPWLT
jgi:von Willebrand factor type A domain